MDEEKYKTFYEIVQDCNMSELLILIVIARDEFKNKIEEIKNKLPNNS